MHLTHFLFVQPRINRLHKAAISRMRERGTARVAIIASSLSMWRLEGVYKLMEKDPRFDVRILLIPFAKLCREEKDSEMEKLRKYFDSKGIAYCEEAFFTEFDPDIVFYPQFYFRSYKEPVKAALNEHRLLCYSPYGVMFIDERWQYNSRFHNRAWKIFLQSEAHREVARKLADNRGVNVAVVGDADSDAFLSPEFNDPWKAQSRPKKRVIWAPHHRKLGRDSFEWSAEKMVELSKKYSDTIQFAFKPHPRLKTELYKTEGWGQERTDEFYRYWAESENTQLETGSFIELFRGSDAMIHDCNSFIAEYLYTRKPVLFLSTNTKRILSSFGKFGKDALGAHYLGDKAEDAEDFLLRTVMEGNDPLKETREEFFRKYLYCSEGNSFSEKVVREIASYLETDGNFSSKADNKVSR